MGRTEGRRVMAPNIRDWIRLYVTLVRNYTTVASSARQAVANNDRQFLRFLTQMPIIQYSYDSCRQRRGQHFACCVVKRMQLPGTGYRISAATALVRIRSISLYCCSQTVYERLDPAVVRPSKHLYAEKGQ